MVFLSLVFILLIVIVLGFQIYFIIIQPSFLGDAPFVPTDTSIVDRIVFRIPLEKGKKMYDLGCGDARMLIAAYKLEPEMEYVGVEKNLYPYLRAKFNLWRLGSPKNIKIIKANIFELDYSDGDIIYLYLFPKVLERLLSKFKKELRFGSHVFSATFTFEALVPSEELDFEAHGLDIIKKMYIYKF